MQLHIANRPSRQSFPELNSGYFPRRLRSRRRSDAARAAAKAAGLDAFDTAARSMEALTGEFWRVNQFKMQADSLIKRGPAVARKQFEDVVALASDDLDETIDALTAALRAELEQIAKMAPELRGCDTHNRRLARAERLSIAGLILRTMRATGHAHRFALLLEILRTPLWRPITATGDGRLVTFEPNDIAEWGA